MTTKRFAKVNPGTWGRWSVVCVECTAAVDPGLVAVFADTQGRPFKDYYCEPCKERVNAEVDKQPVAA